MDARSRTAFALLIVAQAAHSVEEYEFRLFETFGPAGFVSRLFSSDAATGFAVANLAIVLFGLWCYAARVRTMHPSAPVYAWSWTCLELANGMVHLVLAISRGGYFPGVGTAPLLLASAGYLSRRLVTSSRAG
jgi:hypothetical protein